MPVNGIAPVFVTLTYLDLGLIRFSQNIQSLVAQANSNICIDIDL